MEIWKKVVGTIRPFFRLGFTGPRLKDSSGALDVRNSDDSAFVIVRGASPQDPNDFVTKNYADTHEKFRLVGRQADTSSSIPNNTAVEGYVVVTTAGSGAVIGDLLWDNGENDANPMEILSKQDGRVIVTTVALSGGTIQFEADAGYQWDDANTEWREVFDVGGSSGAVRIIRFAIDNSTPQDSAYEMRAGNRVIKSRLEITTPYSGGAAIAIGDTSTVNAYMATTDNNPQAAAPNTFEVDQDTNVPSDSVVRVTITGAPAAGAGVVTIWFTNPNG